MSERLKIEHEAQEHGEHQQNPYGERVIHHETQAHGTEHGRHHREIEQLIKKIEEEAAPIDEVRLEQMERGRTEQHPQYNGSHIKSHGNSRQTVKNMQQQLSKPERQFSKLIHNPAVETFSEAAGTTIARPSGLLTAGIFSLLASLGVLFVCRFYGYEYNYGIGLLFMGIGFFFGLLVEALLKLRPSNSR
jgi:hypothetical protein